MAPYHKPSRVTELAKAHKHDSAENAVNRIMPTERRLS
jgi:hypothetical protein